MFRLKMAVSISKRNRALNKVKLITFFAFILLFPFIARAEEVIKAEVDKQDISQDQTLTYKITISAQGNITAPQFPKFTGFKVLSQVQSSEISVVKGGVTSVMVYAFILMPNVPGTIKIEPATIKIKDKTFLTDGFEIHVNPSRKAVPSTPGQEVPLPRTFPYSEESQTTL